MIVDGVEYKVPHMEPLASRDLSQLDPRFLYPFRAWLARATEVVAHVDFHVSDTRRTLERQIWLYAQGRVPPWDRGPEVTWTLDSAHRYGIAADIFMVRKSTGDAIWEVSSYQWLYRVVPLKDYGLEHIGPAEWVHIQLQGSDVLRREWLEFELKRT